MSTMIPYVRDNARYMIFIDGENLAIRFGAILKDRNEKPSTQVEYEPDAFVWPKAVDYQQGRSIFVMRKYYYTAVNGDEPHRVKIEETLKTLGMESPRVFKRHKTKGSKRVDITLATDMLVHATRKHFDAAVLVAGDEDYVPLVEAVQREGARVYVWFVSNGMSRALRMAGDHYFNLDVLLFPPA